MDVVCAFVGVHHLEVDHVPHHAELVADAVAAHHVAGGAGDLERLAAAVALHDAGELDRRRALVLHAAESQTALQAERDLGGHVGELLLHQLVGGQRPAELLTVHHVLAGLGVAVFRCAESAPGNAVTRAVQAGERALEAADVGEGVLLGDEHLIHHDLAGDRCAQTHLAVDRRCAQPLHALVENEAADLAGIVLRPDDEDVGDRAVTDPHLRAAERIATGHPAGACRHAAGVRTVIGLGQTEAADPLATGELRQVLLSLCFGAELKDGQHDERALHAHHRAVTRVDALHLARDQPVGDVVETGAAIGLRNRGAEQAELTHLAKDAGVGPLVAKGLEHTRGESLLAVGVRRLANGALVGAELRVEQQGVVVVKGDSGHGGLRKTIES